MPEVEGQTAETGLAFAQSHCEELVRSGDPDRYYATLFAPAIGAETASRTRAMVNEKA
jgi:15-cis-phytoene synthase